MQQSNLRCGISGSEVNCAPLCKLIAALTAGDKHTFSLLNQKYVFPELLHPNNRLKKEQTKPKLTVT